MTRYLSGNLRAGALALLAFSVFLMAPFAMAHHEALHDHSPNADECAVCSFFSTSFLHAIPEYTQLPDSRADTRFEVPDETACPLYIATGHPSRAPPRA